MLNYRNLNIFQNVVSLGMTFELPELDEVLFSGGDGSERS